MHVGGYNTRFRLALTLASDGTFFTQRLTRIQKWMHIFAVQGIEQEAIVFTATTQLMPRTAPLLVHERPQFRRTSEIILASNLPGSHELR